MSNCNLFSVSHPPQQLGTQAALQLQSSVGHTQMQQPYMMPQAHQPVPQRTSQSESGRRSKSHRLPIIDPKTGEDVLVQWDKDSSTSAGSNTHSSALKIEAPSPSQTPISSAAGTDSQLPAKRNTDAPQLNRNLLETASNPNQSATESADSSAKHVSSSSSTIANEQQQTELSTGKWLIAVVNEKL